MSEEVFVELERHEDELFSWMLNERDTIQIPTNNDVTVAVRQILNGHERLAMSGSGRNRADPFVIAVACLHGATVVTGEKGGTPNRPKIPSVCDSLDIPCVDLMRLIADEGWVFD